MLSEEIKNKFTLIAERQEDIKQFGYDEGYEAGKKAEYNEFWVNTERTSQYRFSGTFWNKNNFKPNKDFEVGKCTFHYHNWQGTPYDLAAHLEELGITMTMGASSYNSSFYIGWFTRLPVLDFSEVSGWYDRVFYGAKMLVTIDKFIFAKEGKATAYSNIFQGCTALKNVIFEGVCDQSIKISDSPLSVESTKSLILCLKDFRGDANEYVYTVTFKTSSFEELERSGFTDEDKTWLASKSITYSEDLTWTTVIDNLKWNLALA